HWMRTDREPCAGIVGMETFARVHWTKWTLDSGFGIRDSGFGNARNSGFGIWDSGFESTGGSSLEPRVPSPEFYLFKQFSRRPNDALNLPKRAAALVREGIQRPDLRECRQLVTT